MQDHIAIAFIFFISHLWSSLSTPHLSGFLFLLVLGQKTTLYRRCPETLRFPFNNHILLTLRLQRLLCQDSCIA